MQVRVRDCVPVPQDLVHLVYAPHGVHLPSPDFKAELDPPILTP